MRKWPHTAGVARFEQVIIRKRKFDGALRYEWAGDLVEEREGWLVVRHDPQRHEKTGADGHGHDGAAQMLHYVGFGGPVTVLFALDGQGRFLDAKCDAALPATRDGRHIDFIDLDLDVIVQAGGMHYVRDQGVFAERAVALGYDEETKRLAHLGILHALRMVRRRQFPFDGHPERMARRWRKHEG